MFSNRIIGLVYDGKGVKYPIGYLSKNLYKYREEFLNETKMQYNNKNLRKYIKKKLVGYGLILKKEDNINMYSYDENTVTEDDLKYIKGLKFDRDYPDDFYDLDYELEEA